MYVSLGLTVMCGSREDPYLPHAWIPAPLEIPIMNGAYFSWCAHVLRITYM